MLVFLFQQHDDERIPVKTEKMLKGFKSESVSTLMYLGMSL